MKLEGAGHRAAVSLCGARLCDESLCVHGGERLLEGEDIWPLNELRGEFDRLNAVTTLEDENTFFDILVGRHSTPG